MSDKIRYHKRSEKWYDRYPETIWMVAEVFTTSASAVLAFYWRNSGSIIGFILMSLNTILAFIGVIQRSMRLEGKAYLYDQSRCTKN